MALAKIICAKENGRLEIVVPAAWLHDFVIVPKDISGACVYPLNLIYAQSQLILIEMGI